MKPLNIGEVVTAINDNECCDQMGVDNDGEEVTVVGPAQPYMFEDPNAPNGFRYRNFYPVQTKDGRGLICQRHELMRKGESRAQAVYAALIERLTDRVMA